MLLRSWNLPGSWLGGTAALWLPGGEHCVWGGSRNRVLTSSVTPITPSLCSVSPRLATASLADLPCISATWTAFQKNDERLNAG